MNNWKYFKRVTVTAGDGAGTDYQLLFKVYYGSGTDGTEVVNGQTMGKVYCGGKCQADFDDVRFTLDGSVVPYVHCRTSKVDGDYAIFAVKVTEDLDVARTLRVWYGNPDAEDVSSYDAFIDRITGVVLGLPMNEAAAEENCIDYSGNGNNGVPTGTSVVDSPFFAGTKARATDGITDKIVATPPLTGLSNFTVIWNMKWLNNPEEYERPLQLSSDVGFYVTSTGYFAITGDTNLLIFNVTEGTVYHVGLTYNGTTVKPYKNGVVQPSGSATITFSSDILYVACRNTLIQFFKGVSQNLIIFDSDVSDKMDILGDGGNYNDVTLEEGSCLVRKWATTTQPEIDTWEAEQATRKWIIQYYDGANWQTISVYSLRSIDEELNGTEQTVFAIPNTSANRAFVLNDYLVRFLFDYKEVYKGVLKIIGYSMKELAVTVINEAFEYLQRRNYTGGFEDANADVILADITGYGNITVGYSTIGTELTFCDADTLLAMKVLTGSADNREATGMSLRCRASSGTANVKLAIYEDSDGEPGDLVAETSAVSVDATMSVNDFAFTPSNPTLSANTTYWLMVLASASIFMSALDSKLWQGNKTAARSYGDGFPDPCIAVDDVTVNTFNIWITLEGNPGGECPETMVAAVTWEAAEALRACIDVAKAINMDYWGEDGLFNIGIRDQCLVALPFDEGAGSVAYDKTNRGHNATLNNSTSLWGTGKYGNAALFSGVATENMEVAAHADFQAYDTEATVMCWVKTLGDPTGIVGMVVNTYNPFYIHHNTDNNHELKLRFLTTAGAGYVEYIFVPTVSEWYHVAMTFKSGEYAKFYVNGVLVSSQDVSALGDLDVSLATPIRIGGDQSTSYQFNGYVDDFLWYKCELNPKEIAWIYNQNPKTGSKTLDRTKARTKALFSGWDLYGNYITGEAGSGEDSIAITNVHAADQETMEELIQTILDLLNGDMGTDINVPITAGVSWKPGDTIPLHIDELALNGLYRLKQTWKNASTATLTFSKTLVERKQIIDMLKSAEFRNLSIRDNIRVFIQPSTDEVTGQKIGDLWYKTDE